MKQHGQINTFPCGRCLSCLQKKRADWTFRITQELAVSDTAYFITLTYEDEQCPVNEHGIQQLEKKHLQKFLKRLRKANAKVSNRSLRYYSVGEYGTRTFRPHYHSIIFNVHSEVMNNVANIWKHGNVQIGDVNGASIHYTTKYVINRKQYDFVGITLPFATMSRNPGLGFTYYEKMRAWHREDNRTYLVNPGGIKQRLPRYFKDKIFNKIERQLIAASLSHEIDQTYIEEIERLMALHHDPCNYYEERVRHSEETQLMSMNSKNKF